MKKKYVVITVSILFVIVAGFLLIQKNSYAEDYDSQCPKTISVEESDEQLGLIKTDYEQILLPKEVIVKNRGTIYDNLAILVRRGLGGRQFYNTDVNEVIESIPNISSDDYENRYYKQIIFWWIGDLLEGYDNNFNYLNGRKVNIESDSSDKYNSIGDYKFDNNLSALEKKAILESKYGDKIARAIEQYFEFSDWYEDYRYSDDEIPDFVMDDIDMSHIHYYATDDYIETDLIFPTVTQVYSPAFNYYTVDVNDGITVLNQNNNVTNEFKSSEGFKLRIPFSKIDDNLALEFSVQGISRYNEYQYYHNKQTHSNPVPYDSSIHENLVPNGVLMRCGSYDEELFIPLDISYTESIGNLNIKVIDASTGDLLPSAEVTVFDDKDNEVYRQTTTKKEINLKLPEGEYLIKQTVTPSNYESITIQKRVTVKADGTVEAVLENVPLVEVPDTGMNIIVFDIVGGLLLVAAGILVVISLKKRKLQG